jgi:hypothetical protein
MSQTHITTATNTVLFRPLATAHDAAGAWSENRSPERGYSADLSASNLYQGVSTAATLEIRQERYALKVASALSDVADNLPHDISERLRVARQQAVAKRKVPAMATASSVVRTGNSAALSLGAGHDGEHIGWLQGIASALPLIALLVGLWFINNIQDDNRAREVAEVDAALLTDDLPPTAYTDPGFAQFLKARRELGQ